MKSKKRGVKIEMKCMECGYEFKKIVTLRTIEVKCPKCHGYDTEPK